MTSPTEGTYAPRSIMLRGAWAFVDDLDERRRSKLSDDEWPAVLMAASELLYAYSGRLWSGTFADRAEVEPLPCPPRRHLGALGRPGFYPHRRPYSDVVRLPGDPVVEVVSATDARGAAVPHRLLAPDRVERTDGRGWRPGTVIEYRHGLPPPEAGVQAVLTYAYELARARSSDKGCRLPEAVQSVTRQAVTYTIVDRANAAASSRTGLPEVDQWLQSVNPTIGTGAGSADRPRRGGASLLSADLPPRARLLPR